MKKKKTHDHKPVQVASTFICEICWHFIYLVEPRDRKAYWAMSNYGARAGLDGRSRISHAIR